MSKKKKIWIWLGILIIIAVVVIYLLNQPAIPTVKVSKLSTELLEEKLTTTGTIAVDGQQEVYPQADRGEIKKVWVKEGQKVKKGAKLVEYTNQALDPEINQAELAIKQAKIKLDGLQKQKKKGKSANMSSGGVPDATGDLNQQIRLAKLDLEQAKKQLKQAKIKKDQLVVKSKQNGVVVKVNENATSGGSIPDAAVVVADLANVKVEAKVSEYDALKVKEDQKVVILSDAMPGKQWTGQVRKIAILPETNGSQQTADTQNTQVNYPIEISLDQKLPMKIGSRVITEIVLSSARLSAIPQSAVRQEGGQSYVFVVVKDQAVRINVKVGKRSNQYVEILSGITPSDGVIINPGPEVIANEDVIVK